MTDIISSYSRDAADLIDRYEGVSPAEIHQSWLQYLPSSKALVLDVGAGTGRDAAWLADKGHEVVAVEPADGLRELGQQRHTQANIQWVSDTLPALEQVYELGFRYDLVLLNAVWMHVAPGNRERAFRKLADLLKPNGMLVVAFRDNTSTPTRKMYPCTVEELRQLAKKFALDVAVNKSDDQLGRADVTWHTVVFWLPDDGTGALPLIETDTRLQPQRTFKHLH